MDLPNNEYYLVMPANHPPTLRNIPSINVLFVGI